LVSFEILLNARIVETVVLLIFAIFWDICWNK